MDTEKVYGIGTDAESNIPYRLVIGWSDREFRHYARIEADDDTGAIRWEYEPPVESLDDPVSLMLCHVDSAALEATGIVGVDIPTEDIQHLQEAPILRYVKPSEIQRIDAFDTDYAAGLTRESDPFGDDAELEDRLQAHFDSLEELNYCVYVLENLQAIEDGRRPEPEGSYGTIEMRRNSILAQTAAQIVHINYDLVTRITPDHLDMMATGEYGEQTLWDLDSMFYASELNLIDAFTRELCGSRLTDFPKAIQRGYNPTTGLPLQCLNPSTFRWEDTVNHDTSIRYQQYGLSEQDAERMVEIQRTDPRQRDEASWAFMMTATEQMNTFAEALMHGVNRD